MSFFDLLTMIGGLALFLYGMHLLGEGLSQLSGGRLESILEKLTNNPIKAVLMGAGVTAVIQSSSATTVMVVGFVNSGIMKLEQAVGIIMGANIGTTVTSWILSLTGIDSSSFFVQLLKPTSFSPILAIVGVVMIMFSHRDKTKSVGAILVGFAVLMFGMDTMSEAVKPLRDVPAFTSILTRFSNPILGMLAGLILTAVIQSSSASVGILQALCQTGAVGYGAAIPIIMGQNIGTCVTAMISGIGASRNAKRAALIHLYFNIIGTVIFMVIFYAINAVNPFAFLKESATPVGIAVIHSLFNVAATLCLLPFSKLLVKLATLTIREEDKPEAVTEEEKILGLLDVRFLDTPSYGVDQSRNVACYMADMARESIILAIDLLNHYNEEKAARVVALEDEVDRFEDALGSYLVKLSAKNLPEKDSNTLNTLLHCIGDFERISDHARNLKEAAEEMYRKDLSFSDKAKEELRVFEQAVTDILDLTVKSFREDDAELAAQVEPLEEVIDSLNLDIKQRHIKRLRKGKCTIELGFILSDISNNFERISDHCSNIAIGMLEEGKSVFDPHAYLEKVKGEDNLDFAGKMMVYQQKYRLP
ncbi:MAG: Na/Pi cotransporter family protein [Lachnospiraceae bacterium]|nr:Na/Pi cotransporter family protein [Lachnospiraceae bacterium]